MQVPKQQPHHKSSRQSPVVGRVFIGAFLVIGVTILAGCSIHKQKSGDNKEKKVEIATPLGGLKVNTQVDPKEPGLPIYPGARQVPGDEHDSKSANVNISVGDF